MNEAESHQQRWEEWNAIAGSAYPHEKVVQFCFRNYPADVRSNVSALDWGCGRGVHTSFLAREGLSVSACDISRIAAETTVNRLQEEGLKADVSVSSIDEFVSEDRFDLVICVGVLDAAGPEVARRAISRLPDLLAPEAKAFFIFAAEGDLRVADDNPYSLHAYSREEVEDLFRPLFPNCWIDRYVTTYRNEAESQVDWLITIQ